MGLIFKLSRRINRFTKKAVKCLALSTLLDFGSSAKAANELPSQTASPATSGPQTNLVLDWAVIDILPEKRRLAGEALRNTRRVLIETTLEKPEPLTTFVATTKLPALTINQKSLLGQIQSGQALPNFRGNGKPWAMEPVWCSVVNHDVFLLVLIDMQTGRLIAAPHFSIERESWQKYLAHPNLPTQLSDRFKELAKTAIDSLKDNASADALHVQFDLAQETTRADEGSSLCLNLMLGAELSHDYQMTLPAVAEMWAAARRALAYPPTALRPTRRMVLSWNIAASDNQAEGVTTARSSKAPLKLPLTFELVAHGTESVLGQSLQSTLGRNTAKSDALQLTSLSEKKDVRLARDDRVEAPLPPLSRYQINIASEDKKHLRLTGIQQIAVDLEHEQKTLLLSDAPQISKVERGWVYVDKGRAWGLHMDDRLVIGTGKDAIKGHVVGYFGPELQIKSPRGYMIQEGAIVFVRKGQRQTRLGMTFAFDPATYPSSWPPKPSGELAH